MVHVNCLLNFHSWRSLLLPATISGAIAPFAGSSAAVNVSKVLPPLCPCLCMDTLYFSHTFTAPPVLGKGD